MFPSLKIYSPLEKVFPREIYAYGSRISHKTAVTNGVTKGVTDVSL